MGDDSDEHALDSITEAILKIDEVWRYDFLFDLRRYGALVPVEEIKAFGQFLQAHMENKDEGRAIIVLSSNPDIWARASIYAKASPWRVHSMFGSLDESLEWIEQRQSRRSEERGLLGGVIG
jgi:hypothetical protein